jgi:hypothetical protein
MHTARKESDVCCRSIRQEDFANVDDEGVLFVPKAGEMLFHLKKQPKWAGGN